MQYTVLVNEQATMWLPPEWSFNVEALFSFRASWMAELEVGSMLLMDWQEHKSIYILNSWEHGSLIIAAMIWYEN